MVLRVTLLLLVTRVGLSVLGYARLRWVFSHFSRPAAPNFPASPEEVARIVWGVHKVGVQFLGDRRCLTEAMATQLLLSRRNLRANLQIGVALGEHGKLEAHAWIEHQGRVLIGGSPSLQKYSRIPSLAIGAQDG